MKNNRKLNYIVAPLAVLLWGLIGFKIYEAYHTSHDDGLPERDVVTSKKATVSDYAFKPDTTALIISYPDPFFPVRRQDTLAAKQKIRHFPSLVSDNPKHDGDQKITYTGFIVNPKTKKMFAILKVNGQDLVLGKGERSGDITVIKIESSQITINYKQSTRTLELINSND